MVLFFASEIEGELITLDAQESRHCVKVLRRKRGDTIHVTDGLNTLYTTEILDASPQKCTLVIQSQQNNYQERPYRLHIAFCPTKNNTRTEWLLEKITEIGVDKITPILATNSERNIIKPERLLKTIRAAAKQSLKTAFPILNPLISWNEFLDQQVHSEAMVAHCHHHLMRKNIVEVLTSTKDFTIMIGPEGDFTPEEVERMVTEYHCTPVSFGEVRLRTETAAVYATSTARICASLQLDTR